MRTKKLLVAFNPIVPTARSNDFLFPVFIDGEPEFLGLSSGKYFDYGMIVMTGKEVSVNDVFSKLVDLGGTIDSVDQTLESIRRYFELVKEYKIGNILKLRNDPPSDIGFSLELTEIKPATKKNRLP